jgi:hypothetical protein
MSAFIAYNNDRWDASKDISVFRREREKGWGMQKFRSLGKMYTSDEKLFYSWRSNLFTYT